jgi:sulfur carrier protein ThiS
VEEVKMEAVMRLRADEYKIRPGMTVRDAMLQNDILPESVIPTRDGEMITDDELVREGDLIRLVSVISGG